MLLDDSWGVVAPILVANFDRRQGVALYHLPGGLIPLSFTPL